MDRFLIKLPLGLRNHHIAAPASRKKRKREGATEGEQMFLDIGQKKFGRNSACSKCCMVYVEGHPGDEQRHAMFCKNTQSSIKVTNLKNCRKILEADGLNVAWQVEYAGASDRDDTLLRISGVVCDALGTPHEMAPLNSKIYLCLVDKVIAGYVNVEGICRSKCAELHLDEDISNLTVAAKVDYNEGKADIGILIMGVRQIWVSEEHRRKGVASLLVDAARRDFICNGVKKSAIAFSQPAASGKHFAFSYIKKDFVLAY